MDGTNERGELRCSGPRCTRKGRLLAKLYGNTLEVSCPVCKQKVRVLFDRIRRVEQGGGKVLANAARL